MIKEFVGIEEKNCVFYFYASWSSKCNLHLDALARLNQENPDLLILKVNVTSYQNMKAKYNIKRIPTYIYLVDGNIKGRFDGFTDQYTLKNWLKKLRS